MNLEGHYYLTKYICKIARYSEEKAEIIAYSNQLVDDNTIQYNIEGYKNYISQTMNIFRPRKHLLRIFPIFHFIPGNSTQTERIDKKYNKWTVKQNSQIISELLKEAIDSKNLYLIGIATHAFLDTYSHKEFIGFHHFINNKYSLFGNIAIGHSSFGHNPDEIDVEWYDRRLKKQIKNETLFLDAFCDLFFYFTNESLFTLVNIKERLIFFKKLHSSHRFFVYDGLYKKNKWFNDAVKLPKRAFLKKIYDTIRFNLAYVFPNISFITNIKYEWRNENYKETHWYQFQEAVKLWQKMVLKKLQELNLDYDSNKSWW